MNKIFRKVMALLLTFCLALSLMPGWARAEDGTMKVTFVSDDHEHIHDEDCGHEILAAHTDLMDFGHEHSEDCGHLHNEDFGHVHGADGHEHGQAAVAPLLAFTAFAANECFPACDWCDGTGLIDDPITCGVGYWCSEDCFDISPCAILYDTGDTCPYQAIYQSGLVCDNYECWCTDCDCKQLSGSCDCVYECGHGGIKCEFCNTCLDCHKASEPSAEFCDDCGVCYGDYWDCRCGNNAAITYIPYDQLDYREVIVGGASVSGTLVPVDFVHAGGIDKITGAGLSFTAEQDKSYQIIVDFESETEVDMELYVDILNRILTGVWDDDYIKYSGDYFSNTPAATMRNSFTAAADGQYNILLTDYHRNRLNYSITIQEIALYTDLDYQEITVDGPIVKGTLTPVVIPWSWGDHFVSGAGLSFYAEEDETYQIIVQLQFDTEVYMGISCNILNGTLTGDPDDDFSIYFDHDEDNVKEIMVSGLFTASETGLFNILLQNWESMPFNYTVSVKQLKESPLAFAEIEIPYLNERINFSPAAGANLGFIYWYGKFEYLHGFSFTLDAPAILYIYGNNEDLEWGPNLYINDAPFELSDSSYDVYFIDDIGLEIYLDEGTYYLAIGDDGYFTYGRYYATYLSISADPTPPDVEMPEDEDIPLCPAHVPGAAATCISPQLCTLCGEVLEASGGHTVNNTVNCSLCTDCGETGIVRSCTTPACAYHACDILTMTAPAGAVIAYPNITTAVVNGVLSQAITFTVSPNASWELHRNAAATDKINGNAIALNRGTNEVWIKIIAEDATTFKIYKVTIVREDPIMAAAISGVTIPVAGETPADTALPLPLPDVPSQYTGTVTWNHGTGVFGYNTAYTATITLTPLTGWTLTGVPADFFTVAGATSVTHTAGSNVITAVFPKTELEPLGGTASISGTNAIGQTLTAQTGSITGGTGIFIYQWQANGTNIDGATSSTYTLTGAEAGKTISCVITREQAADAVTATLGGGVVPYNIAVTNSGNVAGDTIVTLAAATGRTGDIIALHYVLGDGSGTVNNRLRFTGGTGLTDVLAAGDSSTQNYTVNASDAVNGVITIAATFQHTNLSLQTLTFAQSHLDKTFGDTDFTQAVTGAEGTGAITYTTSNPAVATVTNAGAVTITGVGDAIITAAIAACDIYEADQASYTLTVAKGTQNAPTGISATNETTADANDGTITGVTTAMEYKLSTDADYTAVTASPIMGLAPGTYNVRFAQTANFNAGADTNVTINAYVTAEPPPPEPSSPPTQQPSTPPTAPAPPPATAPAPPSANYGDTPGAAALWTKVNNDLHKDLEIIASGNPASVIASGNGARNTTVNASGSGFDMTVNAGKDIIVPAQIFDTLQGTTGSVMLRTGIGVTFSISGGNIPAGFGQAKIDLSVRADGKVNAPAEKVAEILVGTLANIQVPMKSRDDFGMSIGQHYSVGAENAGSFANLYRFNESTGIFEYLGSAVINERGQAMFGITGGADYVLTVSVNRPTLPIVPTRAGTGSNYQTVVRGDTLSRIALRNGMSLSQLLALNPEITNPGRIRIGQLIRVR